MAGSAWVGWNTLEPSAGERGNFPGERGIGKTLRAGLPAVPEGSRRLESRVNYIWTGNVLEGAWTWRSVAVSRMFR